jgi:RNA polymerase sigma factor (sigma-70 family)
MAETALDFQELLDRAKAGSADAARDLVDRYGDHVLRMVRRRLPERLRSKFDSLDFVQDVWASFFADPPPPAAFAGAGALVAYLTRMAQNKVAGAVQKRLKTARYNVNRERPLPAATEGDASAIPADDPTASQLAIGNETWERLLRHARPADRLILVHLRERKTHAEVAAEVGVSVKTVQRVLDRALKHFGGEIQPGRR